MNQTVEQMMQTIMDAINTKTIGLCLLRDKSLAQVFYWNKKTPDGKEFWKGFITGIVANTLKTGELTREEIADLVNNAKVAESKIMREGDQEWN